MTGPWRREWLCRAAKGCVRGTGAGCESSVMLRDPHQGSAEAAGGCGHPARLGWRRGAGGAVRGARGWRAARGSGAGRVERAAGAISAAGTPWVPPAGRLHRTDSPGSPPQTATSPQPGISWPWGHGKEEESEEAPGSHKVLLVPCPQHS